MKSQHFHMAKIDISSFRNSHRKENADMSKCKAVLDSKKIRKISVKAKANKSSHSKSH